MYYLDINTPLINFQEYRNSLYVDKTLMIDKIQKRISTLNKYICITRPRRFGKTMNANMLAAYFAKGYDSRELFKGLKISKVPEFEEHMNQHHVIYIDLSRLPDPCTSFQEYLNWIKYCLLDDLKKAYHIEKVPGEPMQNLFERTNDKFIFILDEWDSIFYKTFINDNDKKAYLEFLKGLLKDQPYVELAYMTGVLPILQYSKGSELNMFREYNFMNDKIYESYFGFTENEVRELCEHCKNVSYENLKYWYDGYHLSNGDSLFNPRSVNNALSDGVCQNYWTETGPMHEISNCIKYNVNAVREDIVKMVSNIPVRADLEGYAATQLQLDTRDEILSSMVVFGFYPIIMDF